MVGIYIGTFTMENNIKVQISKNRPVLWFSNSTPGYICEENENTNLKQCMHLRVQGSITYNNQDIETTLSVHQRWMDKDDMVYIYKQWNTSQLLKNNKNLSFATTWMVLEGIMLKWNKSDRERQMQYDITYMWESKTYKKLVNMAKMKQIYR